MFIRRSGHLFNRLLNEPLEYCSHNYFLVRNDAIVIYLIHVMDTLENLQFSLKCAELFSY